jgi:hypothetical protein
MLNQSPNFNVEQDVYIPHQHTAFPYDPWVLIYGEK